MLPFNSPSLRWILALVGAGSIAIVPGLTPRVNAQTASPSDSGLSSSADTTPRSFTIVNPTAGNDTTADGSDRAPFKTITRALQKAQPNTIVLLTPGIYSAATGEVFPIVLKPGVTLHGNPQTRGQGIVIQGSGSFLSKTSARQNITILGADQAALVGVTVSNPENTGYGLWVESTRPIVTDNTFTSSGHDGISVVGDGAPLIRNNFFYQNGANGITIYGRSRPQVRDNIFENTGFGITVNQFATPTIEGNRITQNKDGVVVGASSRPVLRNNSIEGNTRDGLVAIAQAQPDLGTATEPGGNVLRNNGQLDINASQLGQVISAVGNEIARSQGRLDRTGTQATAFASGAAPFPTAKAIAAGIPAPPADPIPADPVPATPAPVASNISANSFPIPAALNSTGVEPGPIAPTPIALAAPRIFPAPIGFRPSSATAPAAIPIPVPAPQSRAIGRSMLLMTRLRPAAPVAPAQPDMALAQPDLGPRPHSSAIVIPVPPPERRTIAVVAPAPQAAPPPVQPTRLALSSAAAPTNLLPVPNTPIPIGNVGSGSGVALYQNTGSRNSGRTAAPVSLPYRVIVDLKQQVKAQTLVPGAFRTSLKGRTVIQLGAFGDRAKAEELIQTLRSQGMQATIEMQ